MRALRVGIAMGVTLLGALVCHDDALAQVIYAPQVPRPSRAGDIVGLNLQNISSSPEVPGYITFGEIFKMGAVQPADAIVARIHGADTAVQMDVKAKHTDGSVRHAIITFKAPTVAARGIVGVMLAKGSAELPAKLAPKSDSLISSGYSVSTTIKFAAPNTTTTTAKAATALADNASPQMWLSGPLVNEWRVQTLVNDQRLRVTFDIRAYADGSTHTDVVYGNDWFFHAGKSQLDYSVSISQNGASVFSYPKIQHYLYSLWHKEVNSASLSRPNIQYDVRYLIDTGAIQNYDLSLGADVGQIEYYNRPDFANPMSTGGVALGMGDPGGRPDIAPQPGWTASWIVSQDAQARRAMMGNADASGNVPWHYTDENTGEPIDAEKYDIHQTTNPANGGMPPQNRNGGNPWGPEQAHLPELNYLPYLISGSHYQLQLLQAEGDYAVWVTPGYQHAWDECTKGVPLGFTAVFNAFNCGSNGEQIRAIAWQLRSEADAAYLTPDDDPLKKFFMNELNIAMSGLVQLYIHDNFNGKFGEMNGLVGNWYGKGTTQAAWQQAFFASSLGQVADMNFGTASTHAIQMLQYMDQYVSGLWTSGGIDGLNPYDAGTYYYTLTNSNGAPFTTWGQAMLNNISLNRGQGQPGFSPNLAMNASFSCQGYGGYPWIFRSGLASIVTHVGSTRARQAYNFLDWRIPQDCVYDGTNFQKEAQKFPQFNIRPRAVAPTTSDQVVALLYAVTSAGVPTNQNVAAMSGIITAGQELTLHWSSMNAVSCAGTNLATNNKTSGSITVKPAAPIKYSLTCTGPKGSFSYGPVMITVKPK